MVVGVLNTLLADRLWRWRGCGIGAHRITEISDVVVRRTGNSQVREWFAKEGKKKGKREKEKKRIKVGDKMSERAGAALLSALSNLPLNLILP